MNTALNTTINTTMKIPLLNSIFTTDESLSSLILRIPIGVIFIAHGGQKLFGLFGGYGLEGTAKWMASIGLEPGYLMALMAGNAELFGGLALILGLLVRPAALVLAVTMLVAIFSVHFSNGLFISNKGYEFALALFAASAALVFSGAGRFSLDGIISK